MSEFVEKVEINEEGASQKLIEENNKKLLGFYLGSVLHEDWKKDDESAYLSASDEKKQKNWRVDENGTLRKFKSVDGNVDGKEFTDTTYQFKENDPAYRKEERKVDIRALSFEELPLVWQKENADAGKAAIDLIYDSVTNGNEINIEEMAARVHEAWLSRPNNAWAIEYQSEESKPYSDLSEELKAKDRRHIELALEILEKVKNGELTYDELKQKIEPSMKEFYEKLDRIDERMD